MIKLNNTQTQWLNTVYNKAFRESASNDFAIRFAATVYKASKLNPTFESGDKSNVGIGALPADTTDVDPKNPQEALDFVLARDLGLYINTDGNLDVLVEGDVEEIKEIESQLESELFGDNDTFTGINSLEGRFKRAMSTSNTDEVGQVVDEMVANRVNQRNKVINNG